MGRVQRIEAALSPLEKTLLAQRSHLHFAYTAGSNWHTRIRCEQHHFIYSDLPQFIMDTYEDCRRPPSLHLLDKFDPGGSGSCMKRYSDPTFFKRASAASGESSTDKILKDKKGRKIKIVGGIWADKIGGKLVLGFGVAWWEASISGHCVFTVAGIVDSFVYHGHKTLKKQWCRCQRTSIRDS